MMNKNLFIFLIIFFSINSFSSESSFMTGYGCSLSQNELISFVTELSIRDRSNPKRETLRSSYILPGVEASYSLQGPEIRPEIGGKYEAFIRPGELDIVSIPILHLNFSTKKNDIIYVCIYLNPEDDTNNHVTIHFLKGKNLNYPKEREDKERYKDPEITFSLVNVEFRAIENTTKFASKTVDNVPVVNRIFDMISNTVSSFSKGVHTFIAEIFQTGVQRVVVNREGITMYLGLKVMSKSNKVTSQTISRKIPFISHDEKMEIKEKNIPLNVDDTSSKSLK